MTKDYTVVLKFRCSPEQADTYDQLCFQAKKSLSALIRQLLDTEVNCYNITPRDQKQQASFQDVLKSSLEEDFKKEQRWLKAKAEWLESRKDNPPTQDEIGIVRIRWMANNQ